MIIAIDFDGTCVTHDFPFIGKDIGAVPVLKRLVECGHKLILWTMRSDGDKYPDVLDAATKWFKDNDIPLYGINKNNDQSWSTSPKAYCHLYIDDAALGCPLRFNPEFHSRPFADWYSIHLWLHKEGYFDKKF